MTQHWGPHFPDAASGGGGGGGGSIVFPSLAVATTAEAIRDRIIAVISGIVPRALSHDRFRKYLNEGGADFRKWARSKPDGTFRRFQVRELVFDGPPPISNTDFEERMATFQVLVAYPQTNRTGKDAALDRDDAMTQDRHDIETAIGMRHGRQNFSPPFPDACWRKAGQTGPEIGVGIDFLVITQTMSFRRSMI